jgi:hypothetical protein
MTQALAVGAQQPLTVLDVISAAMRKINVLAQGETPQPQEANNAFQAFWLMLDSWSTYRSMIYSLSTDTYTIPVGVSQLTMGPTGQIQTPRPVRVQSAWILDSSGINRYFDLINDVGVVSLAVSSIPWYGNQKLFYNPTYPNGTLQFYPNTYYSGTLTVNSLKEIGPYSALNQQILMPPGYLRAMVYGLAVELAPEYGMAVRPEVAQEANNSFNTLAQLNAPSIMASMDAELNYQMYFGSDVYVI